jgi:multiple sugar transport system substrate-binding protein
MRTKPRHVTRGGRATVALAALALALALAACGNGGNGGAADSGPVTLRFVGPELTSTFQPVIQAFGKKHPDIRVAYTSVPFDQLNSVLQQRLGAKDAGIDVYTVDQSRVASYAARGQLVDLTAYTAEVERSALAPQYEASTWNGKLWAMPVWTSEQFLYYNKGLLKKAGVTPPGLTADDRWTWEQVAAAGAKAKQAGAEWGLLFDQTDRYYQLQALPESAGGGSGITGPDLLTPDITNDGWVKAMNWYGSLFKNGLSPRGVDSAQMNPLFAAGKAAFFVGGPWALTAFKQAHADKKLDYGMAPHPYFTGGKPATPTDSWSWGINPASEHKEAALEFLRFASVEAEGNLATIAKVFIVPSNKSAFDVYAKRLADLDPPATGRAGELMLTELNTTAVHRPRSIGYVQFEDIMLKAFADVRNGADPRQRLGSATEELKAAWARLK